MKDELTFEQRFTDTAKASGLLSSSESIVSPKGEKAGMISKLRQAAADAIDAYKRSSGKDYVSPEETQKIINRHVMRNVFVDNPIWFDKQKPASALTEEERGKAYVPMAQIPQASVLAIKKQAERLKANVSTRQIERAYAAATMGASDVYITAILTGKQ